MYALSQIISATDKGVSRGIDPCSIWPVDETVRLDRLPFPLLLLFQLLLLSLLGLFLLSLRLGLHLLLAPLRLLSLLLSFPFFMLQSPCLSFFDRFLNQELILRVTIRRFGANLEEVNVGCIGIDSLFDVFVGHLECLQVFILNFLLSLPSIRGIRLLSPGLLGLHTIVHESFLLGHVGTLQVTLRILHHVQLLVAVDCLDLLFIIEQSVIFVVVGVSEGAVQSMRLRS